MALTAARCASNDCCKVTIDNDGDGDGVGVEGGDDDSDADGVDVELAVDARDAAGRRALSLSPLTCRTRLCDVGVPDGVDTTADAADCFSVNTACLACVEPTIVIVSSPAPAWYSRSRDRTHTATVASAKANNSRRTAPDRLSR